MMFRFRLIRCCLFDKIVTRNCLKKTVMHSQYLCKCISTAEKTENAHELKCEKQFSRKIQPTKNIFASYHISKNYTTEAPVNGHRSVPGENESDYHIFYRFPHIVLFRTISRLKLYQTGFLVMACPSAYMLAYLNMLPISYAHSSAGLATLAGIVLYLMSGYMRKWIGIMALNPKNKTVRVSHLTFWGRRSDVFIPIEDVIPICDLPDKPNDIFIKFKRYDSESDLFLSLRYGKITDMEKFTAVMGAIR